MPPPFLSLYLGTGFGSVVASLGLVATFTIGVFVLSESKKRSLILTINIEYVNTQGKFVVNLRF